MAGGRIDRPKDGRARLAVIHGEREVTESLVHEASDSPEALEQLCDLYVPKIYSYVLRRVGRVEDAEDVTSTVFEKVLVNLDSYDGSKASFATWIYRIALNCITDFYRSRGRRKEDATDDSILRTRSGGDSGIERLDSYISVVELLGRLPPKYQEAVTLRYFAGMRVIEVAETLGITETAASKRILRGLDELRRLASGGPLEELM